jgi:hypothetical protein
LSSHSSSRNYLLGLLPHTEYDVQVVRGIETQTVIVRRGNGYKTTSEGVLQFDINHSPDPVLAFR